MLYIILLLYFNIIIMAKSISGGLGTVNLSVQELRLLGGTFTTLDTTTLTVLGTATLGSLIISGTFTIDQLTANTITTQNLSVSGTMTVTADNDTNDNDNKIIFIENGGTTGLIKTSTGLYYNPDSDTLTAGGFNGNVTGNLTGNVTATDITTTNSTASGTTTITALNNTTASVNNRIPFINGNSTETGVLVTRGNFNYNTSTETLNCGTVSATNINSQDITTNGIIANDITLKAVDVVPETSSYNFDYRLLFLRTGIPAPFISQAVSMYFNPSTSKLYVPNLDSTTATTVTTITDTLNLKAVEPTSTGTNCRLCFFDGASTTGSSYNIVKSGNLYFNNTNSILVTIKMQAQIQMNSPLFVMLVPTPLAGLPNAVNASIELYNDSGTVRNRYQHPGGHLFMDGNVGNNLIMTNTTQTRIYNELQCDDDVTITGTLTVGTLNVGTQSATNFSVANNLTVGNDTILSNVPTASGSTALSVLLLGTNKIQRGSITFNPLSNILSTTNIGLTGNLTSSSVTTTTLTSTSLNLSGDLTAGGDVFLTNLGNITTLKTYNLLVKDTATNAVKKTTGITTGVNLVGGESFLTADEIKTDTIILNGLPLNYTETYNADTWSIASNASFGGGNFMLLPSNGTLKQYGSLLNPSGGIFGLKSASSEWGFTNSAYDGLYDINISCYFQNDSNVRVIPRLNLYRWRSGSYSQQTQLHADSSYVRYGAGKINSIGLRGKIHLTSVDTFRIPTLINNHGSTDFADQIASSLYDGTDFVISITYLGNLTETITT